ncbi:MAG: stimulus-sensing domain-containing protein, partial [Alphaproteobacteria bacterium]
MRGGSEAPVGTAGSRTVPPRRRRRLLSPITLRILAVNLIAIGILAAGLLWLGQYKRGLVQSELEVLRAQGRLIAMALGEGAVQADPDREPVLVPEVASRLVRRLAEPASARVRLYAGDGTLMADSRRLIGPGGLVEMEELPPIAPVHPLHRLVNDAYDGILHLLTPLTSQEVYTESYGRPTEDFPELRVALEGDVGRTARATTDGGLMLSVAEPVQHYKRVVGALLLSARGDAIENSVRSVRLNILALFCIALAVTVLLSVYLSGAIARPILRLAIAAERVRRGQGRKVQIPDMTARRDEIGELSAALRAMTEALWQRMDAIERFAADVAHEIKNPLTSLRSAVETAARIKNPEQQRHLMAIIVDDVRRLDRLISDISDASRLDAELSRAESEPVDLARMLETLVDIYSTTGDGADGRPSLRLEGGDGDLRVAGMEDRLVQVFRNLLGNAISFSPPEGHITLHGRRNGGVVTVTVEDEGPGIPPGKEEAIFERFYSERPAGEKFGTHSGL